MKYIKFIIYFLVIIFFTSVTYSKTLNITNIDKEYDNNNISIELNNLLKIHDLQIVEFNKTKNINSPKYKSKSISYNYFSFLDRNFKQDIINCIEKNVIYQGTDNETIYKINKFKIINSTTLKATFSIIFNDLLEVNATIMYGKSGLWVQWPSSKDKNNNWKKLFIIEDKQFKKNIENEILSKYNNYLEDDKDNK